MRPGAVVRMLGHPRSPAASIEMEERLMWRIAFLAILLLTGCENKQVEQNQPAVGKIQQIESPLQNTVEGMTKAKVRGSIVTQAR